MVDGGARGVTNIRGHFGSRLGILHPAAARVGSVCLDLVTTAVRDPWAAWILGLCGILCVLGGPVWVFFAILAGSHLGRCQLKGTIIKSAVGKSMEDKRFECVDRWLTKTLRYDSTMLLSVDELQRRARKREYGKLELLYVAFHARKKIRRGPSMYRYDVDRNETGVFVCLNDESEGAHWSKTHEPRQASG